MNILSPDVLLEISEDFNRTREPESWYWATDGDHGVAIPFHVSTVYRGQNQRCRPMLPSIARGIAPSTGKLFESPPCDQAKIVIRLAQSWWFAREFGHHPAAAHAERQRLRVDRIAVAQHYGIPTGYLDLTDDFDVAAFFATCRETDGQWEPLKDGVGVIYKVGRDDCGELLKPLGPQPLARPFEQKAWVIELPLFHAFDGWREVSIILFQQSKAVGQHFLDRFGGGSKLFPADPLASVADEILKCGELPDELIDSAIKSFAEDEFGIRADQIGDVRAEIAKLASVIPYRRILTDAKLAPFLQDIEWLKVRLADTQARVRPVWLEPVEGDPPDPTAAPDAP
jgi:hypothetical protein